MDIDSLKVGGLGLSGYIVNWADVFSPVVEVGYMIVLIAYWQLERHGYRLGGALAAILT